MTAKSTALAKVGPQDIIAPEALLAKVAADQGTAVVKDVLTGDIAVVKVTYPRGTKKKPEPPVEVEYHVNLAGIGLGLFLAALAGLASTIAWNGLSVGGFEIFPGLKEVIGPHLPIRKGKGQSGKSGRVQGHPKATPLPPDWWAFLVSVK